ncbi:Glycosyl transferase, family 2 [Richelia intracellularis]|nr:Glycosyl transferase, family 2 [Richelia intracellularis]
MWLYFSYEVTINDGVAESGDDLTKFSTIYQWFQKLIHPALMQPQKIIFTTGSTKKM